MEIISVKEKEFKEYGKVIEGLDVAQLLQKMQKTPLPDDVIYEQDGKIYCDRKECWTKAGKPGRVREFIYAV